MKLKQTSPIVGLPLLIWTVGTVACGSTNKPQDDGPASTVDEASAPLDGFGPDGAKGAADAAAWGGEVSSGDFFNGRGGAGGAMPGAGGAGGMLGLDANTGVRQPGTGGAGGWKSGGGSVAGSGGVAGADANSGLPDAAGGTIADGGTGGAAGVRGTGGRTGGRGGNGTGGAGGWSNGRGGSGGDTRTGGAGGSVPSGTGGGTGGATGSGGNGIPAGCGTTSFVPPTGGKAWYVAPNGSDSAAGTMAAPFRTMKRAASSAQGGDVVYLRDGVYAQAENFTATGGAGNPVVFMAEPGEHPILDGASLGLGRSDSVLNLYQPKHVVVAGLEIRNSGGRGVQLIDAEDVVIRDCTIHDVAFKALGLNGNNIVAEGNVVYNAVLGNKDSGAGGGWASAITTQLLEDGSPSRNVVVRGNFVHDAWGECIDALFVDGMTVMGNDVRDCYGVGIYVDTARAVRIEGNVVRASNQAYQRNGHLMAGILLGAEAYEDVPDFGVADVVIANNIVLGTHNGIAWWDSGNDRATNTYKNTQVISNVVWGSQQNDIMFDEVPAGRNAPTGTLVNNILYGKASASLAIGDIAAWTITNNDFPNGKPSTASDASNLAVDPQLGGSPSVGATATTFQPGASSPCRHAGRPVAAVPLDFACAARGTTDTTVGAFE